MPVTPAGFLSLELHYLRLALNQSQTWRAVCEEPNSDWETVEALATAATADEAAALARIHKHQFTPDPAYEPAGDPEQLEDWPFILIRHRNDHDIERAATTGLDIRGQIMVVIEVQVPEAYRESAEDAGTYFENVLGQFIAEVNTYSQSGTDQRADIAGMPILSTGQIDPKDINGRLVWTAELNVRQEGVGLE